MLVELGKVLEIISSYNAMEISGISFSDMYWWNDMIDNIKALSDPNPKPIDNKPHLFGDEHCIDVYELENGTMIVVRFG